MKKYFINFISLVAFFLFAKTSFTQTYSPSGNNSYSTCSGTFYDSGGSGSSYGNSQNYTVTFCSNNGQNIWLNFSAFNTESGWDYMYIYNGNSTGAPLIGTYSGTNSPLVVGGTNTCITIRFTSDGSFTYSGWAATIGCGTPPPTPCTPSSPASLPPGCSAALPFCT
ncbi:MAG TPA: CUB domain-containing protein, partial [Vicingus sp.]|nr:CUB domain-containing protein [Vicingus sp.]